MRKIRLLIEKLKLWWNTEPQMERQPGYNPAPSVLPKLPNPPPPTTPT